MSLKPQLPDSFSTSLSGHFTSLGRWNTCLACRNKRLLREASEHTELLVTSLWMLKLHVHSHQGWYENCLRTHISNTTLNPVTTSTDRKLVLPFLSREWVLRLYFQLWGLSTRSIFHFRNTVSRGWASGQDSDDCHRWFTQRWGWGQWEGRSTGMISPQTV